jgi:ribosomal protein S18 acetylase RimI-like enzyme
VITVTKHGPEVIEQLRPFWLALVHHHAAVAPELGAVFDDEETWARRSKAYAGYLSEPDAFVLLAHRDDRPIGYAVVTIDPGSHTFRLPERVGFIGTLSVLPEARGLGAGRALVERAQQEIEALGVSELRLDVLSPNDAAIGFYTALGFAPHLIGLRR